MVKLKMSPKMRRARLWFLSAVVVGLLPILWNMIHTIDAGKKQDWHTALATGDALVLSAALAGGCVYELLIRRIHGDNEEDTRNVLVLAALLAAFGAALWYGDLRSNPSGAPHTDVWTLAYLGLTIVICLRSLYLTYDFERKMEHSHAQPPVPAEKQPDTGRPAARTGG
jgi:hypothetical protein